MKRSMLWATAFLVCFPLLAQEATPEANGNLVIFARSVWTGEALVSNRKIVVKDGKVVEISAAENRDVPSGARVIEVNWVMPGLVMADSMTLTGPTTEPVSVTPGVRALDGYDPFIPRPALLRSGVTAVYLSPGRNRLVAGQGAVVRPGLADNDDYMIKSVASLHCSVAAEALNPASVFEPPVAPTEEDEPFRPARRQFPRARGGAFMALRELFARATGEDATAVPDSQYNVDLRPLKSLLEGRVPLRVRAETAADIYGALQVARRFKLRLVVEGGTEAWKMAEELGAAAASVVLASGTDPTGKLPPPKPFRAPAGRGHAEAAAILKKAGVRVALVPKKDGAFEDLLWYAATARVPGRFSDEDVLRAVTSDAAKVLGVDALAGTLRVGGAADIVGFDHHPLQAAARPVLVVSAGTVIKAADPKSEAPIAIFAKTIHTAVGDPIENGVVVVEDGKITAVGTNVTVPPGARRMVLPEAVVVPGFIDAGGQAGVRAYRTDDSGDLVEAAPLGVLKLDQPPVRYFDPLFPDVSAVAQGGVTTVVLTPGLGRSISGALSIVKTGGEPVEESVVKEVAGILLDLSREKWSDRTLSTIRSSLRSGKKYVEGWDKYNKAIAEWNKKAPSAKVSKKPRKLVKVKVPRARNPISGTWEGTVEYQGMNVRMVAELSLKGEVVTGTARSTLLPDGSVAINGTFADGRLKFELEVQGATVEIDMEVLRDEMSGNWVVESEGLSGRIIMKRTALPSEKKGSDKKKDPKATDKKNGKTGKNGKKDKDGKKGKDKSDKKADDSKKKPTKTAGPPKTPKKVAALEPYRALFEQDIPAFVAVSPSERMTREIIKVFRDEFELKTVILNSPVTPKVVDDMKRLGVGLACTGPGVFQEEGRWINPALMVVRKRLPVMIRSGDRGDPRSLYSTASYIVRHGMDPADALKMITRWPAQVMGISGRVGAIKRGLDADLVILSGDPFVPGTRILDVMIQGKSVGGQEK